MIKRQHPAVKLWLSLGTLAFLCAPVIALAADDDTTEIYNYLKIYYDKLILPTGTVLAGFVIMAGGISYAMSGGDPSKVQKAKEYIFGAISGLILLITAALIIKFIVA